MQPIRVMIVDDQRLMRDGLLTLLELQDEIEIAGSAAHGGEAVEQALLLRPDVILMDVRMPVMDGVQATREIMRQLPDCRILMLTTFDDDAYIVDALRAGARGYLLKDIPAQDLAEAIRAVYKGIYQLDPAVAGKIVTALARTPAQYIPTETESNTLHQPVERTGRPISAASELSERELEVLRLVAEGATNREIATRLIISEGTVKNHISNILSRLNLRDRTQAAIYARTHGLLS